MSPTNMKELLDYAKQARKQRAAEHRRKFAHEGRCSGLTDKEYARIKHSQKSSYQKARKFTHRAICLLYTSPSPRDRQKSRMPSSA